MTALERRKTALELRRVENARMEIELRIEEMKEEINRLTAAITIQINKEQELKDKLKE